MHISELETPAVTIDLDVMEANIRRGQELVEGAGIAMRPHIKTHKIPEIARMQVAAGAVGLTCQKLTEAEVFIEAGGFDDILVTYNIIGRKKTDRLLALSERIPRLAVVADNETVVRGLSEAGAEAGRQVPVLVEIDTGIGRNGTQTPADATALARLIADLPGTVFDGLVAYPNRYPQAADFLSRTLELLDADGIAVNTVSGGSTPSLLTLDKFPMLTEHRAGNYVYNDRKTVAAGGATPEACAMTVRATVVSVPNAEDRAIVDAGSKVLTLEQHGLDGFGEVRGYPSILVRGMSEEHGILDLSRSSRKPEIGEVVCIVPNHACVVSNLTDEVYGVRGETVEVVWPVAARGDTR